MNLDELIVEHRKRYPLMEARDIYKLIYQGTMGPEHLLSDTAGARTKLEQEFQSASSRDDAPLVENISTDSRICRVNLRPFRYRGGESDRLFQVFLASSDFISPRRDRLRSLWSSFVERVEDGHLDFGKIEVERTDRWLREHDFPPLSHSDIYREAYHPAYRVCATELLTGLGVESPEGG
jgi:hypothetical protein